MPGKPCLQALLQSCRIGAIPRFDTIAIGGNHRAISTRPDALGQPVGHVPIRFCSQYRKPTIEIPVMPGMHGQHSPGRFEAFQQQLPAGKTTKGQRPRGILGNRATAGINQLPECFSQSGKPAFQSSRSILKPRNLVIALIRSPAKWAGASLMGGTGLKTIRGEFLHADQPV